MLAGRGAFCGFWLWTCLQRPGYVDNFDALYNVANAKVLESFKGDSTLCTLSHFRYLRGEGEHWSDSTVE